MLCQLLRSCLSDSGAAYFGAKRYYFGVGGGVDSFAQYLRETKEFVCKVVVAIEDGTSNIRDVLEIRKVASS